MDLIPVAAPDLSGNEERYVVDAIRSSWISSSGAYVQRFEKEFAEHFGAHTAIGVCNGTVALHLALLALNVRGGGEVRTSQLTLIATANGIRYAGAIPVLVGVDRGIRCITSTLLKE